MVGGTRVACNKECRGNVCMVGCCSEAAVMLCTRATPTIVENVVACCGGLVTQLEMQNLRCGVCVCVCVRMCVKTPRNTVKFQAGGQWISVHLLPNEDGGLRLWYLRGMPWRRTCTLEIFELLTSCCKTVFCISDFRWCPRFKSLTFRRIAIHFFAFWISLWRTYELRCPPGRATTLGPCSK